MAKKNTTFKNSFERLEMIVSELEMGSVDLEDAVAKYEEGLELVKALKGKLAVLDTKITELKGAHEKG